ncbi:MAG: hypothetical protein GY926_24610 [bacterium]|nr:hypothetical protein [bacterium]
MKMPQDSVPAVPAIGSAPAIDVPVDASDLAALHDQPNEVVGSVFQQAVVAFEEEAP